MVQAKIIQKCTINVSTNAPGSGRTVKFLNGIKKKTQQMSISLALFGFYEVLTEALELGTGGGGVIHIDSNSNALETTNQFIP